MKNKYADLVEQTFVWPTEEFGVTEDHTLTWNGLDLRPLLKQYGTPLRLTYLPKIDENIQRARRMFHVAMAKVDYDAEYHFCYCTKSNHFSFVMERVLQNEVHLETSSAFDINIVRNMAAKGLLPTERHIVCNGYKTLKYLDNIAGLITDGYENVVTVIDHVEELEQLTSRINKKAKVGIRIASEEEPKFEFYTSRLGIGYRDIVDFYKMKIADNEKAELKMLHFFINTGIKDTAYYWNELRKCVNVYIDLKRICPSLDSLNIGGGFPIKTSLGMDFDYEYMAEEIIQQIKTMCNYADVPEPHIFSEFGSYTVGESGANFYSVLGQKKQNDRELWYMIDSSFMTTLPDSWAINKRFIMLPINKWDKPYDRVLLGGLTCDSDDYYNAEQHVNAIFLPKLRKTDSEPLYIGFFNTGAYQESLAGYGGTKHCLLPSPKHVVIDMDEDGNTSSSLFAEEQTAESMLNILGYE
ncbi:MAG: Lysine/ornithine decarboxylase [Cryomorphaceae bacterium]|nr:MAG: Lysine/ornithine decarboxylase [Cryomorphaceae bacterium]